MSNIPPFGERQCDTGGRITRRRRGWLAAEFAKTPVAYRLGPRKLSRQPPLSSNRYVIAVASNYYSAPMQYSVSVRPALVRSATRMKIWPAQMVGVAKTSLPSWFSDSLVKALGSALKMVVVPLSAVM